jgi:type IV pilus assembly protein PilM
MALFGSKGGVGVDIGSTVVKVVQLHRSGAGVELEKAAVVPIYPEGDRPSDENLQHRSKVDAVKRALSKAHITAKNAVSSVSGESIIVRYLQFPHMPEEERRAALQWEAEEYIPFRLEDVNIDSMVLGRSRTDDDKEDVLLVSAKKDLVERHVSIIREAGLVPKLLDVDSFAFLNCYESNYGATQDGCTALVNIGAEITGISIMHGGVSRFSRDIPVGGDTITNAVASHLRCPFAEAEQLKLSHGANPPEGGKPAGDSSLSSSLMETIRSKVDTMEGDAEGSRDQIIAKAIGGVLTDLITEVRRSIEFFENQTRDMNVARVVLGGGTAVLLNLREHFENNLHLPTEVIDPLRKIRPSGRDLGDDVRRMGHTLGVGIGLGLRGLNL